MGGGGGAALNIGARLADGAACMGEGVAGRLEARKVVRNHHFNVLK